ncbi:MAG: FixH family protein [Actinobacteria bacterium]|nr:FixH family protein [Actinomycetota bacterium]
MSSNKPWTPVLRVLFRLFPLVFAALALGSTGCGRAASGSANLEIDLQVVSEKAVGPATVEVTVRTAEGQPIDDARALVRGDMTHAMPPVLSEAKRVGAGRYATEDFRFTMAGDWVITAEVTLANGEKVERTLKVSGVATPAVLSRCPCSWWPPS